MSFISPDLIFTVTLHHDKKHPKCLKVYWKVCKIKMTPKSFNCRNYKTNRKRNTYFWRKLSKTVKKFQSLSKIMKIKWKNKFAFECVHTKLCLASPYTGENESEARLVQKLLNMLQPTWVFTQ